MTLLCEALMVHAAIVSTLFSAISATDATAKPTMNFTQVRMAGGKEQAVGECYGLGDKKPCGKTVADWWCQQMTYRFATSFKGGCSHYAIGSMSGVNKVTLDRSGLAETLCWVQCADTIEPVAGTATMVTKTFDTIRHPASPKRHLDKCYGPSTQPCNKPIADWWCRHKGYLFASDYKSGCKVSRIRSMDGRQTNCGGNVCGSMCSITCAKFSVRHNVTTTPLVPTVAATKPPPTSTKLFSSVRHPDIIHGVHWPVYCPGWCTKDIGDPIALWWCKRKGYDGADAWTDGCKAGEVRAMAGPFHICYACNSFCTITCANYAAAQ